MAIGNKLFALAEREFKQTRANPVRQKFRAMNLNIGKYDESWDRKRGAAARMMGVVLRENDETLRSRVTANEQATKTYGDAAEWFRREADYLRRTANLLETASDRLTTVLAHHQMQTETNH